LLLLTPLLWPLLLLRPRAKAAALARWLGARPLRRAAVSSVLAASAAPLSAPVRGLPWASTSTQHGRQILSASQKRPGLRPLRPPPRRLDSAIDSAVGRSGWHTLAARNLNPEVHRSTPDKWYK
jgi:hypothetical protein